MIGLIDCPVSEVPQETNAMLNNKSPQPDSLEDTDLAQSLEKLCDIISGYGSLLTAFSGGIDSTLVAAVARQTLGRENAPAVIGDSPSLPRRALKDAIELAEHLDLNLHIVQPDEQQDPQYQRNDGRRCFSCKQHLYAEMSRLADRLEIPRLANGANVDDQGDYRPGLEAAAQASVVSPLVEAGLNKAAVRGVAMVLGLPNWDQPAAACLASRVQYGIEVTPEVLEKVEKAENALSDLGFQNFRVRHHDAVARLEIPTAQLQRIMQSEIREQVIDAVKAAGYAYVTLDLEGFRSGSGNVLLKVQGKTPATESSDS